MLSKFLQIHSLCSYPSALLNRDDAGFAKRIPFGGITRTRISSQCLKSHWRSHDGVHALKSLNVPSSIRSRLTFDKYLLKPLVEEENIPEALAYAAIKKIMDHILGTSKKKAGKKERNEDDKDKEKEDRINEAITDQLTILGFPEVEYFRKEICMAYRQVDAEPNIEEARKGIEKIIDDRFKTKEIQKNLMALKNAAGLDAALFGRMVTSDALARGDAAIHVAHAFTVHAEAAESDYFTAVDNLLRETGELGSAHLNTVELTSGLYYGYVVMDIPLLISNLEGCQRNGWMDADRTLGSQVINKLIHLIATVSPGAKLGSTAPYSYASMIMIEIGEEQPRTFANAFLRPVKEVPDVLGNTYHALAGHIKEIDRMYGNGNEIRIAGQHIPAPLLEATHGERVYPLNEIASWAETMIRG